MHAHKCMHIFINTHIYVNLFFSLHIYISIYIRIHIIICAQRKHTRVSISFSCRFPRQCRILLCTTYSVLCTTTLLRQSLCTTTLLRQSLPRHTHRLLCIVPLIYSKRILLRVSSECARILLLYIFNISSKRVYVVNGKFYRGKILFLYIVNEGNSKTILPN